ncbi:MAG TPA: hypothetical protein VE377_10950 [Candidatus Dormibacteraeota bacterium]|nr:hypothetical protein [Candidatus Dormibacteraeota bacterium]
MPQVQQDHYGNDEANAASQEITPDEIEGISQGLDDENCDRQSPAPRPSQKPANAGATQSRAEQQEEAADPMAERSKLRVRPGIESPQAIENCSRIEQCHPGKRRHACSEEEKDSKRRKSARVLFGAACAIVHF